MYILIDQTTYTELRDLSFAPQTDVTGNSLPINEFAVSIITSDAIAYGQYAELYNDVNTRFAKYWIVYAEREGDAVRVVGRSDIALLDGVTLPAVMYNSEPIADVLDGVMVRQAGGGMVASIDYSLASALSGVTISGYCPEQSARERLQWICFVAGAYVRSFFNGMTRIQPLDTTETLIPIEKTYWRPAIKYSDWVTAVRVTAFSFAAGTPQTTDEWVQVGSTYYIVTRQVFTLTNNEAPATAADNVVDIDGVYLVNAANANGILSYLALLYFRRAEITMDVIDNGEYRPGDRLMVYGAEDQLFVGYAQSAAFGFGKQSKATLQLVAVDTVEGAALRVTYKWGDLTLGMAKYVFPVGYSYSIQNMYLDRTMGGHRYIFRPTTDSITGTMVEGGLTVTVNYQVALDLYKNALHIISVDEVTEESSGGEQIGVIE